MTVLGIGNVIRLIIKHKILIPQQYNSKCMTFSYIFFNNKSLNPKADIYINTQAYLEIYHILIFKLISVFFLVLFSTI